MKTTVDFENMTDEELSAEVAEKVMGYRLDPQGTYWITDTGEHVFITDTFATSLDACREAIEKFMEIKKCLFLMRFDRPSGWGIQLSYLNGNPKNVIEALDKNPARACCVAILKALEK